MIDSELMQAVDANTQQLMFFYEFAKAGAVSVDLNNANHRQLLGSFAKYIEKMGEGTSEELQRKQLCQLLVVQLLKYARYQG